MVGKSELNDFQRFEKVKLCLPKKPLCAYKGTTDHFLPIFILKRCVPIGTCLRCPPAHTPLFYFNGPFSACFSFHLILRLIPQYPIGTPRASAFLLYIALTSPLHNDLTANTILGTGLEKCPGATICAPSAARFVPLSTPAHYESESARCRVAR